MEVDTIPNGNESAPTVASASSTTMMLTSPIYKEKHLTESLKLEHQFLRVPFELYKKTIRISHRATEKEVSAILASAKGAANADISKEVAIQHLTSLVCRLHGLKRKLEDGSSWEDVQEQNCRARIEHLESASEKDFLEWSEIRLNRILVDYMLRMSYSNTAFKLAEKSNILELVDIDVFREAKNVISSLQNKDIAPAISWCMDNRSRLKKSKSKFEFQLRLQEFVELVRADKSLNAIAYARKYLAPWASTHLKELQRVIGTLAFKRNFQSSVHKGLFEMKQWEYLVEQFKLEFCKLYGMTFEPLLNIFLQVGLSALKTPYCYEDECPRKDPLSLDSFKKLALPLPFSKQQHSNLICYITKEPMDTENPPQVLPNGYVYSSKALKEMAKKNNGQITCPRTGLVCCYSDLVRAYIS